MGTTDYQLTVVSTNGCKASATEIVGVFYKLAMPGAFTPNGDGRNDLFRVPPSVPVTIQRLAVYNRLGALVFATANVSVGWDGNWNGHQQPAGVYVWELVYENPLTKRIEMAKGTVILVR
jgi:gliding motility-associated-like protein